MVKGTAKHRRALGTLLAVVAMVGSAIATAVPAQAEGSGKVAARTQRMSEPNLNSQQNGWYEVGTQLTLVCSQRGQPVKGYFSFNIPGGWDDLWYKTSDGSFVADVDVETVASDCSQSGSAAQQPVQPTSQLRVPLDGSPGTTRGFGVNGHNGIDYRVGTGTPVYAADSGTVQFEGWGDNNSWMTKLAGICVLLRHGDKFTGYAHLSRTVVDNGQQVNRGQLIGYSGETGKGVEGQHLHFEVLPLNPDFRNGYAGRVDPAPFL